jgi:HAE1 family hydrophobic/amphiphilic exporter-1
LTPNEGAIIAADLAVVVIGGLFTSTILTLVVVPVGFKLIAGWQDRRAERAAAKEARLHAAPPPPTGAVAATAVSDD